MAEIVAMPKLGFDMAEGTLVRWVITEGGEVTKGAVLAEIETDKATVEVESSATGILYRQLVEEGTSVPVGTAIAVIAAPGEKVDDLPASGNEPMPETKSAEIAVGSGKSVETSKDSVGTPIEPSAEDVTGKVKISPIARRMALEQNLDILKIQGSGPGGRIVKKDLEIASISAPVRPTKINEPTPRPETVNNAGTSIAWTPELPIPEDEHLPIAKLRGIIGKRMVEAKQQVPHFYITSAYSTGKLLELRENVNKELAEGSRLSVNDFIVKAVALSLRQFPNLNASLTPKEIIRHGHINIGIAVAVENGLLTIVVKDADQKPVRIISQEIREMASSARSGKVRPDDIEGSTFSISNLGMFDVDQFVAIINPPEAAILAIGSAQQVPLVADGEIRIESQMKVTISADHRITDGAEAARFMQTLKMFIENPLRLLL